MRRSQAHRSTGELAVREVTIRSAAHECPLGAVSNFANKRAESGISLRVHYEPFDIKEAVIPMRAPQFPMDMS